MQRTRCCDDNEGNEDWRRRRREEEEEEELRTSRREKGRSLDEHRWRKKSRRKRSRESRRHGSTSPRDGSAADCGRVNADDDGREELRKKWHPHEAKEMGRERRIIFHQSATTNTVDHRNFREGKLLI